jgi:hypothetical protein
MQMTEEWGGTCEAETTTGKACINKTRTGQCLCPLHKGIAAREANYRRFKAEYKAERPMAYWAVRYPEAHARWCRINAPIAEYEKIPDQLMRQYLYEIGVSIALMEDS